MAIITIGLHSNNYIAIAGAVILAIAHASSSSSLFIIFGQVLYDRLHTRTVYYLRNIGGQMPALYSMLLIAIICNASTPGTMNWLAELYVLIGSIQTNVLVSVIMCSTVLLTAIYSFWMLTYTSGNTGAQYSPLADMTRIEQASLLYLLVPNIVIGL